MNGDVLFRTMPIGGFNKEDVMEYIGEQQNMIVEMKKQLDYKNSKIEEQENEICSLRHELQMTKTSAEKCSKLNKSNDETIEKQNKKIESLERTISSLEVGYERTKDVEGQIGALVIDALLYSDKIIHSAKSSALQISSGAKESIEKAVSGVGEIGSDITEISDNFGEVIEALVKKLNNLSENLTGVADSLDEAGEISKKDSYVMGETSEVDMPILKERDFEAEAEEEDISDEEIQELFERLNISFTPDGQVISGYTLDCETDSLNEEDEEIKADTKTESEQIETEEKDEETEDAVPIEIPVESDSLEEKDEILEPNDEETAEKPIEKKAENKNYEVRSTKEILRDLNIDDLLKDVDRRKEVPIENEKIKQETHPLVQKSDILDEDISSLLKTFLDSDE